MDYKPDLWEVVIEQIKTDLDNRDETAIYEMLQRVSKDILIGFLPEERGKDVPSI